MKRILTFSLALLCLLALTGCGSPASGGAESGAVSAVPAESGDASSAPGESVNVSPIEPVELPELPGTPGAAQGEPVSIGGTGKVRIDYTGSPSIVRYVTSPAELPDCEALADYDEAWFQDHALVLVTETVGSGSVKVEIASITLAEGAASVELSHEMSGDAGTADIAAWLLWAEVAPGLEELTWTVANPALSSETAAY